MDVPRLWRTRVWMLVGQRCVSSDLPSVLVGEVADGACGGCDQIGRGSALGAPAHAGLSPHTPGQPWSAKL